jgi:hypothetical protein
LPSFSGHFPVEAFPELESTSLQEIWKKAGERALGRMRQKKFAHRQKNNKNAELKNENKNNN